MPSPDIHLTGVAADKLRAVLDDLRNDAQYGPDIAIIAAALPPHDPLPEIADEICAAEQAKEDYPHTLGPAYRTTWQWKMCLAALRHAEATGWKTVKP